MQIVQFCGVTYKTLVGIAGSRWLQPEREGSLAGYTGAFCDGTEAPLLLKDPVQGVLDPGQWAYYTLALNGSDKGWQDNGIELDFVANGGYPVLLAKQGSYPTLLDNDVSAHRPAGNPISPHL